MNRPLFKRLVLGLAALAASAAAIAVGIAIYSERMAEAERQRAREQQAVTIERHGQVMLASGHLIHEEIARFPVLDGRTWNHPAMSDGVLLIRNANEMAAFDLR